MKKILLYLALVILVALSSFALYKQQSLNIVFIGDSITRGTPVKNHTPVVYAGEYLAHDKSLKKVEVSNQGISGFTTVDFLPATHKAYLKVRAAADDFYKDSNATLVFSIMLGTNDSAIKGPTGAPVSPDNYRQNLETITDSLLAAYPNSKIVINYPIWYSSNTRNSGASYLEEGQMRLKSYWPQIDALIKRCKDTHPNKVFKGDQKAYKYFEDNYRTDMKPENGPDVVFYLHPNQLGDMVLGELWAKAIWNAVK